jgi:hypothetical protein
MVSQASRSVLYLLLALGSFSSGLSARSNLVSSSNAQFKIVGLHAQSVSYVEELSQHVVQVAERYLDRSALQFPQSILVSLKPEEFAEFKVDYQIRVGRRGFVNLDLRWEKDLSLRTTCHALAEALLVRYSIYKNGLDGPSVLPAWPASAIGTTAYLRLRPAESKRLGDWIDPAATRNLELLLARKWGKAVADANGYALLRAMKASGIQRGDIRKLMAQSIAGVNIAPAIKVLSQSDDPSVPDHDLVDWWQRSLERLQQPELGIVDTMTVSRDWLQALSDLSGVEGEGVNLATIWDRREDEAMREFIEARYEILLLRIVSVNPAYFNAARSLGALFETYLSEESKRHRYMHGMATFLGDFEDAKDLEDLVLRNLSVAQDQ